MKFYISMVALCLIGKIGLSQNINESISAAGVAEVYMDFKYPELIKISSWDRNEISITGKAIINNGENNDAFKLNIDREGGKVNISSHIENLDQLPKKIMIKRGGNKYYFDTDDSNDPKVQAFLEEKGNGHQYQVHGVIKEIELEIKVPRNVKLDINAKYGLIEIATITTALNINAKYGGIDVSIPNDSPRNIIARTKYGEMFSNLDMEIDKSKSQSSEYYKWITVAAKIKGGGTPCNLESKYGNVYIRND